VLSRGTYFVSGGDRRCETRNFELSDEAAYYYNDLSITGTATLAGTVNVTLLNGYLPPAGTGVTFMTYRSLQGQFDTLNVVNFPGGTFDLLYGVNTFGVRAVYT
jgi:hypothetical protein